MKAKAKLRNKLLIVPAALLVALLSVVGGTKYEKEIKQILNQPTVNQTQNRVLPKDGTVKRVIDGDTIELNDGTIVRYEGINSPDSSGPFYKEATEANKKLVEGKKIKLEYDAYTSDKFGRVLAYVIVGDKNVCVELVRLGLAKPVILEDRRKLIYQDQLLKAQDEAQKNKLGVWSTSK